MIVGDGEEALAKCRLIGQTQARIVLVSSAPSAHLAAHAVQEDIEIVAGPATGTVLAGAVLVFAATGNPVEDQAVVALARSLSIPANAVDQPDQCDFFTPALVNRAPVAIAIGTEGAGPVLAQRSAPALTRCCR